VNKHDVAKTGLCLLQLARNLGQLIWPEAIESREPLCFNNWYGLEAVVSKVRHIFWILINIPFLELHVVFAKKTLRHLALHAIVL